MAYLYVAPAMIAMILLVFFPFLYGMTLAFTNANIYNTDKSVLEIWIRPLHCLNRDTKRVPAGWFGSIFTSIIFAILSVTIRDF